MNIRPATPADEASMWEIFRSVIATGDALPFGDGFDGETFRLHWFGSQTAYVAETGFGVVGMYKSGANYPDHGAHVASATYVVSPAAQGQGIGRALVEHSLARAQASGFMAMQFNYVVSTNAAAVALYEKLGFVVAGTLPKAFRHKQLGWWMHTSCSGCSSPAWLRCPPEEKPRRKRGFSVFACRQAYLAATFFNGCASVFSTTLSRSSASFGENSNQ